MGLKTDLTNLQYHVLLIGIETPPPMLLFYFNFHVYGTLKWKFVIFRYYSDMHMCYLYEQGCFIQGAKWAAAQGLLGPNYASIDTMFLNFLQQSLNISQMYLQAFRLCCSKSIIMTSENTSMQMSKFHVMLLDVRSTISEW
jgi:hypothetical protein